MYASVADLRAEGVTAAEASDARLELLLAEASSLIDRVTALPPEYLLIIAAVIIVGGFMMSRRRVL